MVALLFITLQVGCLSPKLNKSTNQPKTNQQINKSTNQQINKSTNQQINKSTQNQDP